MKTYFTRGSDWSDYKGDIIKETEDEKTDEKEEGEFKNEITIFEEKKEEREDSLENAGVIMEEIEESDERKPINLETDG